VATDGLLLGRYIQADYVRLREALRDDRAYNICITLSEAEAILTNPANKELIRLEAPHVEFELGLLRLWSLVHLELCANSNYDETIRTYADRLTNVLTKLIQELYIGPSVQPREMLGRAAINID
jgi:hypothetical protein